MSIPRDPKRIDRVAELLRQAWHLQSDFRLTQLIMIASDKPDDAGALFYMEDDTMERKLQAFIARYKPKAQTDDHAA
jgi:uncharacterized protein YihD (DUF1040 family)